MAKKKGVPANCPGVLDLNSEVCLTCQKQQACKEALDVDYKRTIVLKSKSLIDSKQRKRKRLHLPADNNPVTEEKVEQFAKLVAIMKEKLREYEIFEPVDGVDQSIDILIGFVSTYLDNYKSFFEEEE